MAIDELGIHYMGLDFECLRQTPGRPIQGRHRRSKHHLSGKSVRNIPVQPDQAGQKSKNFDMVYLDGSHSIYVDLAAAIAAVRLLKPGALFLFDDVRFSFGRRHLIQTTTQYADVNEDGQLTDEASEPHVTIILRDYLIPLFSFEVERPWSDPDWIALRAPKAAAPWMRI